REARREHEVVPASEIAHIGAILIHQCQPLDPALLWTGLVDEDNAAVEITLVPGDALVNGVGNDVGDPPPVIGRGVVLLAAQLLPGEDIPQPELRLETDGGRGDAAGE